MEKPEIPTLQIVDAAVEGIRRLKGKKITTIDLTSIHHTECDFFVICHGTSPTHVESIAHSVEQCVEEMTGVKIWHRDGYNNAIWILLDYGDLMIHIFREDSRIFYNLEGLWSDASMEHLEDEV